MCEWCVWCTSSSRSCPSPPMEHSYINRRALHSIIEWAESCWKRALGDTEINKTASWLRVTHCIHTSHSFISLSIFLPHFFQKTSPLGHAFALKQLFKPLLSCSLQLWALSCLKCEISETISRFHFVNLISFTSGILLSLSIFHQQTRSIKKGVKAFLCHSMSVFQVKTLQTYELRI